MNLSQRLSAFCSLGKAIENLSLADRKSLAEKARTENAWFIEESVLTALQGVSVLLNEENLNSWVRQYEIDSPNGKTVGVAMAGNIPLVGFHDFLCVLMAGHNLKAKLSSQDTSLMKFMAQRLVEIEPEFEKRISFSGNLKGVDAMIATGSDNTSRYFEYYFRKIPHIIRKNRASCAMILGEEPAGELELLGKDIFTYFGLGCRNISKLFIPEDFDLKSLVASWQAFHPITDHHKYANNYHYQRTILLVNREEFFDGEFVLLKESQSLVSPISIVYYERYQSQKGAREKIETQQHKLQVVTSAKGWFKNSIPFGEAQFPLVTDYADNVDTMRFLEGI